MTTPYVKGNILNGQLGSAPQETDNIVAVLGHASTGVNGQLQDFDGAGASEVKSTYTRGKLFALLALLVTLDGHGPTIGVKLASTAGTVSAVASSGTSPPVVGVTGTPDDDAIIRVEIIKPGARGVATFRYCKDYDAAKNAGNWSAELVTAASVSDASLGIALTFATGSSYSADNRYDLTCTAPTHSNTNITDGFDALIASGRDIGCVVVLAAWAGIDDATRAAAMASAFGAISTKLDALQTGHRPLACVIEAPAPLTTDIAGMAAWRAALNAAESALTDPRIQIATGYCRKADALGGNNQRRSLIFSAAEKFSKAPISEDFGRKASGPLRGVTSIEHDQFAVGGLSDRYTTARSIPRETGFYFTEGRQFDVPGGDFELTQNLRVIQKGYKVGYSGMTWYLNETFDTAPGGKITEDEAQAIDAELVRRLEEALVKPGHASAVTARVARNDTILSSKKLRAAFGVRPRGVAKFVEFDIFLTRA